MHHSSVTSKMHHYLAEVQKSAKNRWKGQPCLPGVGGLGPSEEAMYYVNSTILRKFYQLYHRCGNFWRCIVIVVVSYRETWQRKEVRYCVLDWVSIVMHLKLSEEEKIGLPQMGWTSWTIELRRQAWTTDDLRSQIRRRSECHQNKRYTIGTNVVGRGVTSVGGREVEQGENEHNK